MLLLAAAAISSFSVLPLDGVLIFLLRSPVNVPRLPNGRNVVGDALEPVESCRRSIGDIPALTAAILGEAGVEGVPDTDSCVFSSSEDTACFSIKMHVVPGLRVASLLVSFAGIFNDRCGDDAADSGSNASELPRSMLCSGPCPKIPDNCVCD